MGQKKQYFKLTSHHPKGQIMLTPASLHPLYSDMENNSDMDNMLTVPRPIRKHRTRSKMKMQRRSRRSRARPAKRNTLPLFTPTPPPCPSTKSIVFNNSKTTTKKSTKRQKRRIRTFYSKKWGNRLYGLSTDNFPQNPVHPIVTNNNSWHTQLSQRTAFNHDEDLESLRSPSPTISAAMDYALNYDSSVSNIAANTDNEGYHDEEDDETQINHMNRLKIIVSAPDGDDEREMDKINIKRLRRRYIPSDTENDSALSDAFSSSEDLTDDDDENTNHGMFRSSLFLSGNNKNYGVYSCFPYSDQSDTDYLSAQSGDFDELTICYHNDRNIPFRNRQMMNSAQYCSDLGPSDIGSSDTDYLSDSIPPPLDH